MRRRLFLCPVQAGPYTTIQSYLFFNNSKWRRLTRFSATPSSPGDNITFISCIERHFSTSVFGATTGYIHTNVFARNYKAPLRKGSGLKNMVEPADSISPLRGLTPCDHERRAALEWNQIHPPQRTCSTGGQFPVKLRRFAMIWTIIIILG